MQNNNLFFDFLVELLNRLRTKKPKIFVYLQAVVGFIGAVTGIPAQLEKWHVVLPPALTILENKFVAACSVGFIIASQLASASKVATVTKDGVVLKQTDAEKLPFTAKAEVKKAQVDQIPNSSTTLAEVKNVE